MRITKIASTGVVALLFFGCVDEELDTELDEVNTSTEEQEFGSNWNYSWGDTKYNTLDIGSAHNRACFLSGVAGYLTTNTWPAGGSQAGVGVVLDSSIPFNLRWKLYVDPAMPLPLQAWARCVSTTSGFTAEATWRSGQPPKFLAAKAPGRQCFLTQLTTGRDGQFEHGGFRNTGDTAYVYEDADGWKIYGYQYGGLVWAHARCIDVTVDQGETYHVAPLGQSDVTPLEAQANGNNCFLTQVTGKLDVGDWVQGPFIAYNAAYNFFDLHTKNGSGGRAGCAR